MAAAATRLGSRDTVPATSTTAPAIEIQGLRKTFRRGLGARHVALDGLDLVVEPGRVHGFLGPNGSGKTTTIRALLGLVRADEGTMRLFGHQVPEALPDVIRHIGAVVESPQFFPHFSGRRNLRLLAQTAGVKRRRVDEVLEIVGLHDRAKDAVKAYSLGMRQRLAIAATLLKEPSLLILDEPNNGLDPAGIREVRDLMRGLADGGVTVLLSSHILAEVQQVCDSVSIVSRGRHVVTGPVAEVLAAGASGDVRVRVEDAEYAATVLTEAGLPVRRDGELLIVSDVADPSWITQVLARRRLFVSELTPIGADLESVFLDLTGTTPVPGRSGQVGEPFAAGLGAPPRTDGKPPPPPRHATAGPAETAQRREADNDGQDRA
ncbi:MAG TPA: ABC transporter ATP-binding protein [Mycobacteriales bacterium]|jgi:ABC-2 type transport system ATP-binding protein|nr:ABC transporter ATP-binding protein [Mycobacteriales bacterium]